MITAYTIQLPPGVPGIRVVTGVDDHGNVTDFHDIDLFAVAAWRELLGIDDPTEALEAIIKVRTEGEPDHDPVTGKNHWTETYQLLRLREQAREDAAAQARHEDCCEAEVAERAERAAYDAVHQPIGGGECALDRCRREARRKLGVEDPARKCGTETRTQRPPMPERPSRALMAMRPVGGKAQVLDLLAGEADYLLECTQIFLHQLSGHDTDQVTPPPPEPEPDPDAVILAADELLAKYQEANRE